MLMDSTSDAVGDVFLMIPEDYRWHFHDNPLSENYQVILNIEEVVVSPWFKP